RAVLPSVTTHGGARGKRGRGDGGGGGGGRPEGGERGGATPPLVPIEGGPPPPPLLDSARRISSNPRHLAPRCCFRGHVVALQHPEGGGLHERGVSDRYGTSVALRRAGGVR